MNYYTLCSSGWSSFTRIYYRGAPVKLSMNNIAVVFLRPSFCESRIAPELNLPQIRLSDAVKNTSYTQFTIQKLQKLLHLHLQFQFQFPFPFPLLLRLHHSYMITPLPSIDTVHYYNRYITIDTSQTAILTSVSDFISNHPISISR